MPTWNTDFNNKPSGDRKASLGDDDIRELKQAIYERLGKEFVMNLSSGLASEDGWARGGAGRAYVQTSMPTKKPDGATDLDSDDDGRFWLDYSNDQVYIYRHDAGGTTSERWLESYNWTEQQIQDAVRTNALEYTNDNTFSGQNTFNNNNEFSGNNTHSGDDTLSGTKDISGATFSGNGTFSGDNTHSGNSDVTGSLTFSGDGAFLGGQIVDQVNLKTSLASYSTSDDTGEIFTLSGGLFSFFWNVKVSSSFQDAGWGGASTNSTSYIPIVELRPSTGAVTAYMRNRYVTSSGEIYWVFILRRKDTGDVISMWQAPDHPSFGAGEPDEIPVEQPFYRFDPSNPYRTISDGNGGTMEVETEVVVINPLEAQRDEIKSIAKKERKDMLEVIQEYYDIDDIKTPLWPAKDGKPDYYPNEVTIGIEDDEFPFGGKANIVKKKIPKPSYVNIKKLVKKS